MCIIKAEDIKYLYRLREGEGEIEREGKLN
jgi:hypothetical protein